MAAIIRVRDENGNVTDIPAIVGAPGKPGEPGEKGEAGGYYTPSVKREDDTLRFSFAASEEDMPTVGDVTIGLPGGSIELDPTLTQSGKAADAKAVGDALAELEAQIPESGGIAEETDPTVPAWAKAPEKPSYTAEEVGAQPAGNYATKDEIPATLPNPHKLTFSGAVNAEYDGSEAVEVVIPQGGGGASWKTVVDYTLTEGATDIVVDADADGNPFSLVFAAFAIFVPKNPETTVTGATYWWYFDSSCDNDFRAIGSLAGVQNNDRYIVGNVSSYGRGNKSAVTSITGSGNFGDKSGAGMDEHFSFLRLVCKQDGYFFPAGTRVLIAGIPADGGADA